MIQDIKSLIRNSAFDGDIIAAVTKASATEKERNLVKGKHHNHKKLCVCMSSVAHPIDKVKWKWLITLIILVLAKLINIFLL